MDEKAEKSVTGAAAPVYASFPRDLEYRPLDQINRKFVTVYLIAFVSIGLIVGGFSFIKPSNELTEKDVLLIKKRYAQLELNKPKKEEEAKPKKEDKGEEKAAAKKEKSKIDRSKETKEERNIRKQEGSQERAKVRENLKQEI